jgi:hypothetical protein
MEVFPLFHKRNPAPRAMRRIACSMKPILPVKKPNVKPNGQDYGKKCPAGREGGLFMPLKFCLHKIPDRPVSLPIGSFYAKFSLVIPVFAKIGRRRAKRRKSALPGALNLGVQQITAKVFSVRVKIQRAGDAAAKRALHHKIQRTQLRKLITDDFALYDITKQHPDEFDGNLFFNQRVIFLVKGDDGDVGDIPLSPERPCAISYSFIPYTSSLTNSTRMSSQGIRKE